MGHGRRATSAVCWRNAAAASNSAMVEKGKILSPTLPDQNTKRGMRQRLGLGGRMIPISSKARGRMILISEAISKARGRMITISKTRGRMNQYCGKGATFCRRSGGKARGRPNVLPATGYRGDHGDPGPA